MELVPTSAQQDAEDYAIDSPSAKRSEEEGREIPETNKRMRKEYLVIKEKHKNDGLAFEDVRKKLSSVVWGGRDDTRRHVLACV